MDCKKINALHKEHLNVDNYDLHIERCLKIEKYSTVSTFFPEELQYQTPYFCRITLVPKCEHLKESNLQLSEIRIYLDNGLVNQLSECYDL